MSLKDTVASIETHLTEAYNVLEEKGADISEQKNIENLAATILTISAGGKSTLTALKQAVNKGTASTVFPVGTEIPDTYAGNDNPLIVAQYLDSSNNSAYGGAEGVILVRKYVEPTAQLFGFTPAYNTSIIKNFLDTTYYDNSSDELKAMVADITIPFSSSPVAAKWFIMSDTEICASGYDGVPEGIMWDYWKEKTGLTSPNNNANTGRVVKDRSGANQNIWLRSIASSANTKVCFMGTNGLVYFAAPNDKYGVLPACLIAKEGN